jgi:hypothetical protein
VIDEVQIVLDGQTYFWACESAAWSWSEARTSMKPPEHIVARLNRLFIEQEATKVAASIDDDKDFERLYNVLRRMGARDEDFDADYLISVIEAADPERFEEVRFHDLPDPAHSPLNCRELRDWMFSLQTGVVPVPDFFIAAGDGPFEMMDFLHFTSLRGSMGIPATRVAAEKSEFAFGHLVLGREGWTETKIDELIELHRGRVLRIYSQEMYVAMIGSHRDPFSASREILVAFRAGHPGLEFVSEGWPGWVNTIVPFDRAARSRRSQPDVNWRAESPLHALGYCVGRNGLPATERRAILRAAFMEQLPQVGDIQYMAEWGNPNTAERLKKMANTLASNCRNQKKKENRSEEAIRDWESDLAWLRDTFYRGHISFHWPDTTVF